MKTVSVIGAGFSGLTLAWALERQGLKVNLIDASERTGGMLFTVKTPWGPSERAANSFSLTREMADLMRDIGCPMLTPRREAKRRWIWNGRRRRWPLGVFETGATLAAGLRTKFASTSAPKTDETMDEWGRRNMTEAFTKKVLSPAMQGIYACDGRSLSAELALAPLLGRQGGRARGLVAPSFGMSDFVDRLTRKLAARGVRIQTSTSVQPGDLVEPRIFSGSLREAKNWLPSRVNCEYLKTSSPPLIAVTAFFSNPNPQAGFGCLVPREQDLRVLGVLLNHWMFERSGNPAETWIFGGADDPGILGLGDEALREIVVRERQIIFGAGDMPVGLNVTRWEFGLPHYDVNLARLLRELSEGERMHLHGNWSGGLGASRILERSLQLAKAWAKEVG